MHCPHCQSQQSQSLLELFGFAQQRCKACGTVIAIATWASLGILFAVVLGALWFASLLRPEIPEPLFRGFTAVSMALCSGALLHAGSRSLGLYSRVRLMSHSNFSGPFGKSLWVVLVLLFAAYGVFHLVPGVKT